MFFIAVESVSGDVYVIKEIPLHLDARLGLTRRRPVSTLLLIVSPKCGIVWPSAIRCQRIGLKDEDGKKRRI